MTAQARLLPDGRRLHLHHGPIDLIVEAFGKPDEIATAYQQAMARFKTILEELCEELPLLRRPNQSTLQGPTACRMCAAIAPHGDVFVTPMVAVAGAVADEVLASLVARRALSKAYVNNGGDCAFYLNSGQSMTIAGTGDHTQVKSSDPARGVATSGWGGRSFSLGIADAVTVLARSAAEADAAATLIANLVNCDASGILRTPAREIDPDTDLGSTQVTTFVPELTEAQALSALNNGLAAAYAMQSSGLIVAARLTVQGHSLATKEPINA